MKLRNLSIIDFRSSILFASVFLIASSFQLLASPAYAQNVSGAIGGLDYVRAVAQQPNLKITYVSRKPPNAWREGGESRKR